MSRPAIAIDVDDVLFPFMSEFARLHNSLKDTSLTAQDFYTYRLGDVCGGTPEEIDEVVYSLLARDSFDVLPLTGARDALSILAGRYDLHIVTSRPPVYAAQTKAWLDRHLSGVIKEVHVVGNQHDGTRTHTKAEMCQLLGLTHLVDDQPAYIAECTDAGMHCVLFGDYGWNADFASRDGVTRCGDWAAVVEYFDGQPT